jgi:hypothetical protein
MIITYANGKTIEGILLSSSDNTIRIALKGGEDVAELNRVGAAWVSEDCKPVQFRYEWEQKTRTAVVSEADCVCTKDLATRLIQLLSTGDEATLATGAPARLL